MLELITEAGNLPIHDIENTYSIKHKWNGRNILHFEMFVDDPGFSKLAEEAKVYETIEGQTYNIKGISAGHSTADVDCEIDLDDWRKDIHLDYYNNTGSLPVTMDAVVPDGWRMNYERILTQRRSVNLDNGGTPLDIALMAQDVYGCAMQFNTTARTCTVHYPSMNKISDTVLVEGASMRRRPDYTGKSTELVTRIYPVGADGLTIEDVNGGKNYVENHDYTKKVICQVWKDERYEDPRSLLDDAQALVDSLAAPSISWEIPLSDLYRADPHKWQDHKVSLYQRLQFNCGGRLIAATVVEETVYPYRPDLNGICVNSIPGNSINTLSGLVESLKNPNSDFNAAHNAAISNATARITGSKGGRIVTLTDDEGKPVELLILSDSQDYRQARSLWRFNEAGLGHSSEGFEGPYTLALTSDGRIVAEAIQGKLMASQDISLTGKFSVYDGDTLGGYLGYMSGMDDDGLTHGIGVSSPNSDIYIIATESGVRLQAGSTRLWMSPLGDVTVDGNLVVNGSVTANNLP